MFVGGALVTHLQCTFFPIIMVPWWGVGDLLINSLSSELSSLPDDYTVTSASWWNKVFFHTSLYCIQYSLLYSRWALKTELFHCYSHFVLSYYFTGTLGWGNYRILRKWTLQKTNSTVKPLPDSPSGGIPASGTESLSHNITKVMILAKSPVHILCSPATDLPLRQSILSCLLRNNVIIKNQKGILRQNSGI